MHHAEEYFVDRVFACAARAPGDLAITGVGGSLTYQQLTDHIEEVALFLRDRGVLPGDRVGVRMPRSVEAIVTMLALFRAGACYVPLAHDAPPARNGAIVDDAGLAMVLSRPDAAWFAHRSVRPVVGSGAVRPASRATSKGIAYVIHTSGSTGRPKAVAVDHSSLARYCAATVRRYRLCPDDVVLGMAPMVYDGSVQELLPTLYAGATAAMSDAPPPIGDLFALCERLAVTVVHLPTAYWHAFCAELVDGSLGAPPRCLRLVTIGGEAAQRAALARWHRHVPTRIELLNAYGPTETTVAVSVADLTTEPGDGIEPLPIGRPLGHARLHVLGGDLRSAPQGRTGELSVGGPTVALGYLGRPDETAARFVPDPLSDLPGARMYRTGDLVRQRPDAQLVFVGRSDRQVKIRGHRIEPGEIETALLLHPDVLECRVGVVDGAGGRQLVAHVRPAPSAGLTPGELRDFLAAKLPTPLNPSHWHFVGRMPVNERGKVDLAGISAEAAGAGEAGDLEGLVARVFTNVLASAPVAVDDDLFQLGGDSLSAARVVVQLRREAALQTDLATVLHHPTPRELAAALRSETRPARS